LNQVKTGSGHRDAALTAPFDKAGDRVRAREAQGPLCGRGKPMARSMRVPTPGKAHQTPVPETAATPWTTGFRRPPRPPM
jgi:hypothetical protein